MGRTGSVVRVTDKIFMTASVLQQQKRDYDLRGFDLLLI